MAIPDERIDDLIARWERAFGEHLTREDARAAAARILHLYRRLLRRRRRVADFGDVGNVGGALPPG